MVIINSCELVTFVTAIACTITNYYSDDELVVLASVFTQLGDTITTILAQNELCNADESAESALLIDSDSNTNNSKKDAGS